MTTYVFKGGVIYRGTLDCDESGEPGNPIRLTSNPQWGEGLPMLVGSSRLPGNWVKADTLDAAILNDRIPAPDQVWALDLKPLGILDEDGKIIYDVVNSKFDNTLNEAFTGFFRINEDGSSDTIWVAQTPDRQSGDDNFQLDYWHAWDQGKQLTDPETGAKYGVIHDEMLVGHPEDWFVGGNLWPQYPWAMGTPAAHTIPDTRKNKVKMDGKRVEIEVPYYNPEEGTFFQGAMGGLKANVRFKIDNLPQYLDTTDEHYLDNETGILYYRPATGANPNQQSLELITRMGAIEISDYSQGYSNIEISGLRFSFVHGSAVGIGGNMPDQVIENITVKNCEFRDIAKIAVAATQGVNKTGNFWDNIRVADCYFENIWEGAISIEDGFGYKGDFGELGHVEILRNKVFNSGIQHGDNIQSSVEAINLRNPRTAVVAGNIVERSFGSGIMVFGGRPGTSARKDTIKDIPLTRILIFQNKTEDTATGNNDYGGMSLWQSGPTYAYNNVIGNSPGHMPGGWFGNRPMNLSYPLYLDGAFKIYSFNNIIWGRTTDPEDPYRNMNQAYFMVFGFLNDFVNNTVYNFGEAMGGSSGARQNIQGNLMAGISDQFFRHAHGSLPSQIGGGDTNDTAGVGSLAYENNILEGKGEMGDVASVKKGADKDIDAPTFAEMQKQMEDYPIRLYGLGEKVEELPITRGADGPIDDLTESDVDFRPRQGSAAINGGGTPFIPWGLYGVVGEWQFNKNLRDPKQIIDYAWYMSKAHVNRNMYHFVTPSRLQANQAEVADYIPSQSEDWVEGALRFNGNRYAVVTDKDLKADIIIPINNYTGDWSRKAARQPSNP